MATKLSNNATGRLAVSLTAASTQLSMVVGDAVKFPTIAAGSGDNFPLTAVKANGELEIMLCTLTNGNVFTVQRGQEGTSPKEFSAGDRIELRLTAGTVDGMIDDRIEVVLEDLGTAAYKDVGTSSDNVMEVGAFGLGRTIQLQTSNINLDTANLPVGFYSGQNWTGTPVPMPTSNWGYLIVENLASDFPNYTKQTFSIYSSSRTWFRVKSNGTWSPWEEIYHTSNFPPVGFVYTQFPGEAAPSALFGGTWSLLFNTEGIAFRTEGGNASSFGGGIQQHAYGSHSHSASSNSTGAHTHNTSGTAASAGGHSHTASTNSTGSHSHSGTASSAGAHSHTFDMRQGVGSNHSGLVKPDTGLNILQKPTKSAGAHTHSLSINNAGEHSHTVSVNSGGAHTHSVSGTAASAGAHSHTITVDASGATETRMTNRTIRVWKRTA